MAAAAAEAEPPSSSMALVLSMRRIEAYFRQEDKHAFTPGDTLTDVSYGERLQQAMQLARLTDKDARSKLATALGISVQAVGQVLTGSTKAFTADKSAKAARFLKVDHYWLATGEGEPKPPGLSEEAIAFAAKYDRLDRQERERWALLVQVARTGVPDAQVERDMPITAKKAQRRETQKG